jgi:hypothetical protein
MIDYGSMKRLGQWMPKAAQMRVMFERRETVARRHT